MQKSERPKSGECWNLNNWSFEQTCSDFRPFGSFDRSDFGAYSIKYSGMPKSKRSNRLVPISDTNLSLKSERFVRILAFFSVRAIFGTEQNPNVREPNMFGFRHSTVFILICMSNINPNLELLRTFLHRKIIPSFAEDG